MKTNTHTKIIKVHTLVIDDTEIEAWLNDPDPLIDALRTLLITKAPQNGNGHGDAPATATRRSKTPHASVGARREKDRKRIERVPCESCGVLIAAYRQGKHACRHPALIYAVTVES
jgi:hypothetical protein